MDEADIANDAVIADMERRLAEHRAARAKPAPENCEDCEEPIPQLRRDLRLRLCVECATAREKAGRFFRKG